MTCIKDGVQACYYEYCKNVTNEQYCEGYVDQCAAQYGQGKSAGESTYVLVPKNGNEQENLDLDECLQMSSIFAAAYGEPEDVSVFSAPDAKDENDETEKSKKPQGTKPQGTSEIEKKNATSKSKGKYKVLETIHVGDEIASMNGTSNTKDIVKYARKMRPTEYGFYTIKNKGEDVWLRLTLKGVDITAKKAKKNNGKYSNPCTVYVVPSSFKYDGEYPIKTNDMKAWLAANGKSQNATEDYFASVTPKKSKAKVEFKMAPCDYKIIAVAGELKNAVSDKYDNFSVKVEMKNMKLDPSFGVDEASTIVLGEEYEDCLVWSGTNLMFANDYMPITSDMGTRLYCAAYRYHPIATSGPNADPGSDSRTFTVKPGKVYNFHADISGIDSGAQIKIKEKGKTKYVIDVGGFLPEGLHPIEEEVFLSRWSASKPSLKPNKISVKDVNGDVVSEYTFEKNKYKSSTTSVDGKTVIFERGKIIKEDEEATVKTRYYEKTPSGTGKMLKWEEHHYKLIKKDGIVYLETTITDSKGNTSYDFEELADEYDGYHIIRSKGAGSMKTIDLQFKATSKEVKVDFIAPMLEAGTGFSVLYSSVIGNINVVNVMDVIAGRTSWDELRFDHIDLKPVQ